MLAVQGPLAREIVQAISDSPLPAAHERRAAAPGGRRGARVRHRLHRRGRRRAAAARPRTRPALWDEIVRRGAMPAGLGARDTLRLEVCFHLYGNDLSVERGPIEAGLGWCCKEDTGFIGSEAVRAVRAARTGREARRVRARRARDRAPGQPGGRRRRGHQRHALAVPADGHRHGLRAGRARRDAAPVWRSTFVARCAPPWSRTSRSTERAREWRRPAIPRICCTTPNTTGRASTTRIPTHATLGITWYAQDALGEVVFFEPPAVGTTLRQGRALHRGRVGQGRLRRHRAALRRDRRGQRGARREPGDDQRGPLRRGLARQGAPDRPRRARGAAGRRVLHAPRWLARLALS